MKTCFSTVTGYPGARSNLLVRLACIAFVSGSTISLSFAGYQYGGVRGSPPGFVGPVQRIGFTASHGNVAVGNPYLGGYRGGAMGYPEYRGPLVAPNRAPVGSRNAFVPSPASQIDTIRRQEVVPQTRDPNPPQQPDPSELLLRDHNATPRRSMLRGAKLGHNIYLPIPRRLKRAQGSTKNSSSMRISLLLTHGFPTTAERALIGQKERVLTLDIPSYAMISNYFEAVISQEVDTGSHQPSALTLVCECHPDSGSKRGARYLTCPLLSVPLISG